MPGTLARVVFSWQALGAALLGIVLAKWTWVLFAPASAGLPPAAWEASDDAGRLFGTARVAEGQGAAPVSNIKLIGVFAHRTRGFAVMQVDDKQIGVAQGEEVKPGVRLVETHGDHVMLEQAGVRQRVDLTAAAASGATAAGAMSAGATAPAFSPAAGAVPMPAANAGVQFGGAQPGVAPGQIEALQQQLDAAGNMPPEQREMLKRQLDKMRGQH